MQEMQETLWYPTINIEIPCGKLKFINTVSRKFLDQGLGSSGFLFYSEYLELKWRFLFKVRISNHIVIQKKPP